MCQPVRRGALGYRAARIFLVAVIARRRLFGFVDDRQSDKAHSLFRGSFIRWSTSCCPACTATTLAKPSARMDAVLYSQGGGEHMYHRVEIVMIIHAIERRNSRSSLLLSCFAILKNSSRPLEIHASIGKYVLANHDDLSPQLLSGPYLRNLAGLNPGYE
jgi:hypothetical protein